MNLSPPVSKNSRGPIATTDTITGINHHAIHRIKGVGARILAGSERIATKNSGVGSTPSGYTSSSGFAASPNFGRRTFILSIMER